MTSINLAAIAGLAVAFFGLQPVRAYQAPLVRGDPILAQVVTIGTASIGRSKSATAKARQSWLLQSEPVHVANAARHPRAAKRRAPPQ
jgi:hypothetical protein